MDWDDLIPEGFEVSTKNDPVAKCAFYSGSLSRKFFRKPLSQYYFAIPVPGTGTWAAKNQLNNVQAWEFYFHPPSCTCCAP
ncbi:hypothetical protein TNCT_168941 [Trichonephila clavata]|uniref:Uncharacterized protein n=1 Tax=Trichonephila clavata TaxID=2740835 RepID=A0A8X6FSG9_TRICU|nr:hypothetical protein TNCT_168941 [Trichonephila clavata]